MLKSDIFLVGLNYSEHQNGLRTHYSVSRHVSAGHLGKRHLCHLSQRAAELGQVGTAVLTGQGPTSVCPWDFSGVILGQKIPAASWQSPCIYFMSEYWRAR